jgi:hypothetical protein
LENLCNSKTKYQDKQLLLNEYKEIKSLKLFLIMKMILEQDGCFEKKEAILADSINQFSNDNVDKLDLAMACILEFSGNIEEQELILRNRLEKKKLLKYLNLIESADDADVDSEEPDASVSKDQKKDDDLNCPSARIKLKSHLTSSDSNLIVLALERLLSEIKKPSSLDLIRNICKEDVGPIFATKSQDPLIVTLIFELIIKLGIDKKNERAVVGKLEQFASEWPLESRDLTWSLYDQVEDENLKSRLRDFKVERLSGSPLMLEDIIPAYLLTDRAESEKDTHENDEVNIFQ